MALYCIRLLIVGRNGSAYLAPPCILQVQKPGFKDKWDLSRVTVGPNRTRDCSRDTFDATDMLLATADGKERQVLLLFSQKTFFYSNLSSANAAL